MLFYVERYGAAVVVPQVIAVALWVVLVLACYKYVLPGISVAPEVHVVAGSLVALLSVFPNNVTYARYTEARTLLGRTQSGMRTVCTVAHAVPQKGFGAKSSERLEDIKPIGSMNAARL